jgi:hypothetical protein
MNKLNNQSSKLIAYSNKVDAQLSVSLLRQKGVFFLIPFIQMHMVINISLNLLIGTWI